MTTGYTDGTFKPQRPLNKNHAVVFMQRYYDEILQAEQSDDFTRGDMMVLLKAINDGTLRTGTPTPQGSSGAAQSQRFPDVPADHYAYQAVEWAAEAGVTTGYDDGTFKPQRPLNKNHAVVFMQRYYDEILQAEQSDDFTRGDMMVLLKAINDGTLRNTDATTDTEPRQDGSANAPFEGDWHDSELGRLLDSPAYPDLYHPLNPFAVGSPAHIPSELFVTTTGAVPVTVYICGEPGAYSSADLASVTANLNSVAGGFFREQSSGRFEVTFTSGAILTPELDWNDLLTPRGGVSEATQSRLIEARDACEDVARGIGPSRSDDQIILMTDFWLVSTERISGGVARGNTSWVAVRPASGTSPDCTQRPHRYSTRCEAPEVGQAQTLAGLFVDVHELGHSVLHLPDLYGTLFFANDAPTGDPYAIDEWVSGRDPEIYGSLMGEHHELSFPPAMSCFLRRWLGWPVGGQSAPCAGVGASAPLFSEVSFDGDDLKVAWLAPLFTGGSHIAMDEYVVSLQEEVYTRDALGLWEGVRDVSTATVAPTRRRHTFSNLDPDSVYVVNVEPRTTHETRGVPLRGSAARLVVNTLPPPATVNVSATATEAFLSWPTTSEAWPDGTPLAPICDSQREPPGLSACRGCAALRSRAARPLRASWGPG